MVLTQAKVRRWEQMDKDLIELDACIEEFELFNRTEGKSPATIQWYNLALNQFQKFLKAGRKSSLLGELGEPMVRQFILYLQDKHRWEDNPHILASQGKLKAISIQTYIRALRAFFNWLNKEGYTAENRLAKLKPPKAPTKLVEILTQEEIARLEHDSRALSNARERGAIIPEVLQHSLDKPDMPQE